MRKVFDQLRRDFPKLSEVTYINTASLGLPPKCCTDAVMKWLEEREYGNIFWLKWEKIREETKQKIARMINAEEKTIAIVENTSWGLNIIANSLKWKKGDNIILNDLEFPTNIFPWQIQAKKHSLEIRVIRNKNGIIDIRDIREKIDDKTRVIAISWVQFSNGFVSDLTQLAELAHSHDAILVVDGIQGVGAIPIDVRKMDIDVLVCGGHKWLLAFPGAGFMYIKKEILEDLDIKFGGWLSDADPFNFDYREYTPAEGSRRFEIGSPNFAGIYALNASVEYLLRIGVEKIYERNLELTRFLLEKIPSRFKILSPLIDNTPKSSIILLAVKDAKKAYEKLKERKIIVAARKGGLRVSINFYNNEEDIEKLLRNLSEVTE